MLFPCTTWSRARWPPLRTSSHLQGLPSLNENEKSQVDIGNCTYQFACKVVAAAIRSKVPCVCENPQRSMAWMAPPMSELMMVAIVLDTDMCQYRARWKKRTKLCGWNMVSQHAGLDLKCSGRGECSLTGKQHIVLTGTVNGVARTRLAQAYPPALARKLAEWLYRSQELKVYNRLVKSCCGPDH